MMARPSGLCSLYTLRSLSPAISRLPTRKIALVAGDVGGHEHAGLDDAVIAGASPTRRVAQNVRELADAGLDLALLFLGGVVAAVFLEVAFFAREFDLLGDFDAALSAQRARSSLVSRSNASCVSQVTFVALVTSVIVHSLPSDVLAKQMRPAEWPVSMRFSSAYVSQQRYIKPVNARSAVRTVSVNERVK